MCARLRTAGQDASAGSIEEVERIVKQIRRTWPQVRIILRADSGFCRDELMKWREKNKVDYVLGMARNERLRGAASARRAAPLPPSARRSAPRCSSLALVGQDVIGEEGIAHESEQIALLPPIEPDPAGFTIHVHADNVPEGPELSAILLP